jgi:hypothetical protein
MAWRRLWATVGTALLIGGCATLPTGPSVMVMPPAGKPFEAFQADDSACRQWVAQQAGGAPAATANQTLASGAVVGTLIGAGLGAAIGAASGHPGADAAIGAGSGLVGGTLAASGPAYASGWELQRRYDMAYQQCMYAKGNQIPGAVRVTGRLIAAPPLPPPPPPGYSPAPPGPPPSSAGPPPPLLAP